MHFSPIDLLLNNLCFVLKQRHCCCCGTIKPDALSLTVNSAMFGLIMVGNHSSEGWRLSVNVEVIESQNSSPNLVMTRENWGTYFVRSQKVLCSNWALICCTFFLALWSNESINIYKIWYIIHIIEINENRHCEIIYLFGQETYSIYAWSSVHSLVSMVSEICR